MTWSCFQYPNAPDLGLRTQNGVYFCKTTIQHQVRIATQLGKLGATVLTGTRDVGPPILGRCTTALRKRGRRDLGEYRKVLPICGPSVLNRDQQDHGPI